MKSLALLLTLLLAPTPNLAFRGSLDASKKLLDSLSKYEVLSDEHSGRFLTVEDSPTLEHSIRAFGRELTLDLTRVNIATQDFEHVFLHADGTERRVLEHSSESLGCIYRGSVRGHDSSRAVLSFCGQATHGTIKLSPEDEYHVASFGDAQDRAKDHTVVFRRTDVLEVEPFECGVHTDDEGRRLSRVGNTPVAEPITNLRRGAATQPTNVWDLSHLASEIAKPSSRSLAAEDKYFRVVVFNDFAQYQEYGENVHRHAALLMTLVQDLYSELYTTYTSRNPNHVRFALAGVYTFVDADPAPIAAAYDSQRDKVDVDTLLENFQSWGEGLSNVNPHDLRHLLSNIDFFSISNNIFSDGVVGLAYVNGVCDASYKSGVTQSTSSISQDVANIFAHELGHNLGLQHITEEMCAGDFIMDASSSPGAVLEWSTCTADSLGNKFSNNNYNGCSRTSPGNVYDGEPVCGDGIIEGTEECDCIFQDCSDDPCCDGATCTLAAGATCSASQPCCEETCQFSSSAVQCRAAGDLTCDIDEYCTGTSAECPADEVEANGTPCQDSTTVVGTGFTQSAACYQGECKGRNQQCRDIAESAGKTYYTAVNQVCGQLQCKDASSAYNIIGVNVDNGVPCCPSSNPNCDLTSRDSADSNYQCYSEGNTHTCTKSTELKSPSLDCSNDVLDDGETDVDCGGSDCYACSPGKNCLVDTDCLSSSSCNMTLADSSAGGLGICSEIDSTGGDGDSVACEFIGGCPETLNSFMVWVENNVIIASVAGAGILVVLLACCAACCCIQRSSATSHGGRVVVRKA